MSLGFWLTVLAVVLLMASGICQALRRKEFSEEEFERESKRPSLMRTGFQEFQGFLEPEKKDDLEVVKEEKKKTDQVFPSEPPH